MPIVVRTPTPGDADAVGRVHYTCWRETYTGLPDEFWAQFTLERRLELWRALTTQPRPGAVAALAEVDDEIVGLAVSLNARAEDDESAPPRHRELASLYLLRKHQGSGLGQALLDAVLDPDEPAMLWVADPNPRAQAFYRRNRFVPDGRRSTFGPAPGVPELRMVR